MSLKRLFLTAASLAVMVPAAVYADPAPDAAAQPAGQPPAADTAAPPARPAHPLFGAHPAAAAPAAAADAAPAPTGDNAPITRAELPALIKQAIMDNPDIVMDALKKAHDKQEEASKKDAMESLEKHKADIFNDPNSPSVGDEKTADVTVVEFFDYHCGYCKRMLPAIAQLINDDKKVRVVFKEFPILAEDSVTASRAALAMYAAAKDKFFDFHTALMKSNGKFDDKLLGDLSQKEGVPFKKLKGLMEEKSVSEELEKNRKLAEDLGIRGTPALIVGDQLLPGAISYEELKKIVETARNENKEAADKAAADKKEKAKD